MQKRTKTTLIIVGIALAMTVLLLLNKNGIVRFLFHHRYFDGPSMEIERNYLGATKKINFQFTLEDNDFINSFSNTISGRSNQWRPIELDINEENYSVELSRFNNYFKYLRLNDINRSFSLRFPKKSFHNHIRNYDLFQVDKINLLEQQLIYKLGRKLGLYIPHTEYADMQVHRVHDGLTILKQSFDHVFLEQNKLPHSVIFMMEKGAEDQWHIRYLYNEYDKSRNPGMFEHLERFTRRLEARDPNLLLKYFDLDYMARFEVLRHLLGADSGFVLEDNIKLIYNIYNGKLYPLLDESNLYNMQTDRDNETFKLLNRQMAADPRIKRKKRAYILQLAGSYDELIAHYRFIKRRYEERKEKNIIHRFAVHLISGFFENNVYRTLKRYKERQVTSGAAPSGTGHPFFLDAKPGMESAALYTPLVKAPGYLDPMLLDADAFREKYGEMIGGLSLEMKQNNHIRLKQGDYTLKETVFIPMGYLFEIEAGTVIRMGPGVSFISYSPLHILGSQNKPVVIRALDEAKPFGVWAAVGRGGETCRIEYLDFSGAKDAFEAGCHYPGGLNFHWMNVEMKHSEIHHTHGHDGLNAKGGNVALFNNYFHSNLVDHAALDYCDGVVSGNRFIDDTADREGDALDLSGSRFLVDNNEFAHFLDKGLSIGEDSKGILYRNLIRHNRIGVASKNRASVLLMDNRFADNFQAVAAYRKDGMYGGGDVYLMKNSFHANDHLYKLDGESKIYNMERPEVYKETFDRLMAGKDLKPVLAAVNGIINDYRYKENRIDSFFIGDTAVEVDEKHKVLFASLGAVGASTVQTIRYRVRPDAEVFIKPFFYGAKSVGRDYKEFKLENNQPYDFKDYIYHGKVILKYRYQRNEYDLYVTTGALPVIEIDTTGEHGIPRIIHNEPKIPCKIRVFSNSEAARKSYKSYVNNVLEAKIEGRGKKLPKWKYGITFDKSFPFEGMGDSKHWVLESSFVEKSLMRSKIAFDLLEQFRLDKKRQRIAPRGRFVEVVLNGSYNGVYLLMEHINRGLLGMKEYDKNDTTHSLLYRARNKNANYMAENFESFYKKDYKHFPHKRQPLKKEDDPIWGWHSGFEQRYPHKKKHGEYWKPLEDFVRFVALAPDKEFHAGIFRRMDRENYIDLWIFIHLMDDSDGLYKNRYLGRQGDPGAKWFIVPWDKDGVMGRKHNMKKRSHKKELSTHLYRRCMTIGGFRAAFKEKWSKLLDEGIISKENIHRMIDRNVTRLKDAQTRNFKRWPINYYKYPDSYDFNQEVDYLKEWIKKRIKRLKKEFDRME